MEHLKTPFGQTVIQSELLPTTSYIKLCDVAKKQEFLHEKIVDIIHIKKENVFLVSPQIYYSLKKAIEK